MPSFQGFDSQNKEESRSRSFASHGLQDPTHEKKIKLFDGILGSGSNKVSYPHSFETDPPKTSSDSFTQSKEVKIEAPNDSLFEFGFSQSKKQNLLFIPKVTDKKNGKFFTPTSQALVLKKISYYVKNIIFNHEWISRTRILQQIFAMDSQNADLGISTSIRANLKRRVYDSINVMVASGIVVKKSVVQHYKKEYFYKPAADIGEWLPQKTLIIRPEVPR